MDRQYEEDYSNYITPDLLRDIEEYERSIAKRNSNEKRKSRFPSDKDVVEAIKQLTQGVLTRDIAENLYERVKEFLEEQGYDTRYMYRRRFWRLVTNLVKKGILKVG